MNEHAVPTLVIGLVVSLGVGFLIGYGMHDEPRYDFNHASEAAKFAEESTRTCYAQLTAVLMKQQEVAH